MVEAAKSDRNVCSVAKRVISDETSRYCWMTQITKAENRLDNNSLSDTPPTLWQSIGSNREYVSNIIFRVLVCGYEVFNCMYVHPGERVEPKATAGTVGASVNGSSVGHN